MARSSPSPTLQYGEVSPDGARRLRLFRQAWTRWSPGSIQSHPRYSSTRDHLTAACYRTMAQSLPRLSLPAVLALGSTALGAAFATGLLLGELRQSREWEGAE